MPPATNLPARFFSRFGNDRAADDPYGPATIENRTRIACEIIRGIKERCGADFVVQVLVNGAEENDGALGDNALVNTPEETVAICQALEAAGADALELRLGTFAFHEAQFVNDGVFAGYGYDGRHQLRHLLRLRQPLQRAARRLALRLRPHHGRLPLREAAREYPRGRRGVHGSGACSRLLRERPERGVARHDLYAPSRGQLRCGIRQQAARGPHRRDPPLLPLPELPGRSVPRESLQQLGVHRCHARGYEVRPADGDKNVMVIGGGPAGMEAARVAAERGYAVTLYEKNGLGGLLDFAEMVKGKHESLGRLRNYLSRMLEVEGVNVVTGQEVDAAFVREQSPDVVIVATGGVRPELAAAGTAATPVIGVTDFLASEIGERVAVLGFNAQATDTAHYLIAQGKKVTVIAPEPAEAFGTGQAMMLNAFVKPAFFAAGGRLMPECTLKSVGDGEIVVTNSFGMDVTLACDCVVDASTMSPNTALADELSGEFDVHVIGDAAEPLSIQNAITAGNLTARNC